MAWITFHIQSCPAAPSIARLVNVYRAHLLIRPFRCTLALYVLLVVQEDQQSDLKPRNTVVRVTINNLPHGSRIRLQANPQKYNVACRISYAIDEWVTKGVSRECYANREDEGLRLTISKVRPSSICKPGSRSGVARTHLPYKIKKGRCNGKNLWPKYPLTE